MRRLSREQRTRILALYLRGNSLRGIGDLTGHHVDTVMRLTVDAGQACAAAHGALVRDLTCRFIQVDELWAFVGMKQKRVPEARRGEWGIGDVWTFTSMDAETKLVPTWLLGPRTEHTARALLLDLGRRISGSFQLTTDGAPFYRTAVPEALGPTVDFAQLRKFYDERDRYVGSQKDVISGDPLNAHISTSLVERLNLTLRTEVRRYARRTNAHSKKVYNLSCALALFAFCYNFARPHMTLTQKANGRPTTPAMASGLAKRPWTITEIVQLIEAREPTAIDVAKRRKDRRAA